MSISWNLYDDSGLSTLSTSPLVVNCENDLSDGSHDYTYYFGSVAVNKILQATSNPGVDAITITPTYILPTWEANTAYILGDSVIPTSPNGYRYVVTTAGTSSSSEPSPWGTILNGTTTDGGVTWTLVAEDSPTTEIILALSSGDLDTNIAGAALAIGSTLDSGVGDAVAIYVRVTNSITQVSSSVGTPELGLNINGVVETSA